MKATGGGQRVTRNASVTTDLLKISTFATPLGYWAILGRDQTVHGVTIGHADANSAQRGIENSLPIDACLEASDWFPQLRQRLQRYANGERVEFDDIQLQWPRLTQFQQTVIDLTRQVKFGETITYGELATRAKHPGAARAVGTVMATNRFPIIIPCHRVLSASGLGGFSAGAGVGLKNELLNLEAHDRRDIKGSIPHAIKNETFARGRLY